jgi:transcriptional regulator
MYIPASFRESRVEILHDLIRAHSFASLISQVDGQLFATHLPLLLDASRGPYGVLRGHLARANPHWQTFTEDAPESLVIFQGAHAYISPNWYAAEHAVPTWNYTAVHAYGRPRIVDDAAQVRALLDDTVGTFESCLPRQWSTADVSDEYVTNMARAIVAFELPILRLEGKRKLGQNRSVADVRGAAAGLQAHGDALGREVATQMLEAAGARP